MDLLVDLSPADAGELLTLQRAAFVPPAQDHGDLTLPPLRQSLDELRAELADPAVVTLGLRAASGRLLASVRSHPLLDDSAARELARLVVAPDQQGRGLGTRLLREIEARQPADVRDLWLFTGEHSTDALRLYARCGYVESRRTPVPAGYALVHLVKHR